MSMGNSYVINVIKTQLINRNGLFSVLFTLEHSKMSFVLLRSVKFIVANCNVAVLELQVDLLLFLPVS